MLFEGRNGNINHESLTQWQIKCLKILNLFLNSYFNEPVSENLESIICEAGKINEKLKECLWIPLNFHSHDEFRDEILFINGLIREDFDAITSDNNKKIIFIWDKSIEDFENILEESMKDSDHTLDLTYLYDCLQRHRKYRYLSYDDLLNKGKTKLLYTENDPFWYEVNPEIETFIDKLERMVQYCMNKLSKFDDFSFEYEYNDNNKDELSHEIRNIYNHFNNQFPWFFYATDELLNFLRYQIHRFIKKSEKRDIEKSLNPFKNEILNIKDYDEELMNNSESNEIMHLENSKIPNNIHDVEAEFSNEIFVTFHYSHPPLDYDWLSDGVKNKLNEIKNKYPNYFFSWKDVLYYIEGVRSRNKLWWLLKVNTDWVFCDIDGTLVLDWHINAKTTEKLKLYHEEWKHIQLWTAGNIYNKKKLLNNLLTEFEALWLSLEDLAQMWIVDQYRLKSTWKICRDIVNKYDYEWLQPEVVIDDRNYEKFVYILDIVPRNFVNVNSL